MKAKVCVLWTICSILAVGPVLAQQQAVENVGCGLGTVLWGERMQNALVPQTMAVTTNGTFGNQTFGISSGTLECEQPDQMAGNERLHEFAGANMDSLAHDIAAGQGESLETLAELMGIPPAERPDFYASLQNRFTEIFLTGSESSGLILDRISLAR